MKRISSFLVITIAFLGLSAVAFGQSTKAPRTVDQQIFKRIIGLPNYGVFDHIAFENNGGTVTLSGKVLSLGTRKAAENAVEDIPGVTRVINNIENLTPGGYDGWIRRQLINEFSTVGGGIWLGDTNPSIRIIVDRGRVTLEGFVGGQGTRDLLNLKANTVPGVFSVTNNIQVGRGAYR